MDLHTTVTEFFHDAVTTALRSQSVTAAEPTEFYLVNLLSDFTKATRLDEEPLALQMAQLSGTTPDVRMKGLKHIGDTSLYVSGFFADSLTRRLVDVDYYIAMGGSAYGQLAGLMDGSRTSAGEFFRAAYRELAAKFAAFVQVLGEVRRTTNFTGGQNLLRLCEEWVRTGNEWLAKRLRDTGVVALPVTTAGERQRN
jgi:hypothetical protein